MTENVETEKAAAKKALKKAAKAVAPAAVAEPKVFAVVRTGGKQYRVFPGSKISVEKLEAAVGETITFTDVLMVGREGGTDIKVLATAGGSLGVSVIGRLVGQIKEKKVLTFKKRRRGGYTKKQGHRQKKSEIIIESVSL